MTTTATHNGLSNNNGNFRSHRKEKNFQDQYTIIGEDFQQYLVLRTYGTPSRNTACVWTYSEITEYSSGTGSAGGYGYHRPSAAADEALKNAGFNFPSIAGRGDSEIYSALENIARNVFGLQKFMIHKAHA